MNSRKLLPSLQINRMTKVIYIPDEAHRPAGGSGVILHNKPGRVYSVAKAIYDQQHQPDIEGPVAQRQFNVGDDYGLSGMQRL